MAYVRTYVTLLPHDGVVRFPLGRGKKEGIARQVRVRLNKEERKREKHVRRLRPSERSKGGKKEKKSGLDEGKY